MLEVCVQNHAEHMPAQATQLQTKKGQQNCEIYCQNMKIANYKTHFLKVVGIFYKKNTVNVDKIFYKKRLLEFQTFKPQMYQVKTPAICRSHCKHDASQTH
jgi:hypothetical protein